VGEPAATLAVRLEPRVSAALDMLSRAGLDELGKIPAAEMRQRITRIRAGAAPGPAVWKVTDRAVTSGKHAVPIRIYAATAEPAAIFIYLHGGGWTLGSVDEHDAIARHLAVRTAATIISVDYRLAPEHPFPAAFDDALAVFRWTINTQHELSQSPVPLIIGGDSAGANLAAAVSHAARGGAEDRLAGVILVYPCLDGDIEAAALKRFTAPFLTREQLAWFFDQYVPNHQQRLDPRFAPLRAVNFRGAPPALIITAEYDILRDEGDRYAARLREAGCRVESKCYAGMVHGFFALGDLREAEAVRDDIAAFINSLTNVPAAPSK
jgi:acetyl esterase